MDPRMFPFAGLFPMQPGHWRRIHHARRQGVAAAVAQYHDLSGVVTSCPANAYFIMYEAEIAWAAGLMSVGMASTSDYGAAFRALSVASSASTALQSAGGIALISSAGAGFAHFGLSDATAPWSTALAARGGPDPSGKITGFRVGVENLSGAPYTVEIVKDQLSVWALE